MQGCNRKLADWQWFRFCGETDMGQTAAALCTECGGEYKLASNDGVYHAIYKGKLWMTCSNKEECEANINIDDCSRKVSNLFFALIWKSESANGIPSSIRLMSAFHSVANVKRNLLIIP